MSLVPMLAISILVSSQRPANPRGDCRPISKHHESDDQPNGEKSNSLRHPPPVQQLEEPRDVLDALLLPLPPLLPLRVLHSRLGRSRRLHVLQRDRRREVSPQPARFVRLLLLFGRHPLRTYVLPVFHCVEQDAFLARLCMAIDRSDAMGSGMGGEGGRKGRSDRTYLRVFEIHYMAPSPRYLTDLA